MSYLKNQKDAEKYRSIAQCSDRYWVHANNGARRHSPDSIVPEIYGWNLQTRDGRSFRNSQQFAKVNCEHPVTGPRVEYIIIKLKIKKYLVAMSWIHEMGVFVGTRNDYITHIMAP